MLCGRVMGVLSKALAVVMVVAGLALSGPANAAPITGYFNMAGAAILDANLPDAESIDFSGNIVVLGASGDFDLYLDFLDLGTIQDLPDFDNPVAISDFWTVGGFSFELTHFDSVEQTLATGLDIVGSGTITGNGFDSTPGIWTFSGQDGGAPVQFSFSATTVPEPTTFGLLGFGFIGLGLSGRKRRKIAQRG